ncbi:MAG: AzlD domain-containing protein [Schwartzia sp.]|nr:AzlD domain-containing protein [Schwartzia sp. (in: firmicutes)]
MTHDIHIYILVMSLVTLAIRILPITLIRRQVKSRFIRSFLYYVPYVTLAVMTFPAIIEATRTPLAGAMALVGGIFLSWIGRSMFQVSIACCVIVFAVEQIIL